ncbi:hypothetical protein [Sphingomonas sp.]|uniref:hypothetical protein n=1 Tax=Sphingomonas sp. TaxID=28214 RepID=UPI0025801E2E|nr:hypothetical protein [Sphingomonas sp.]
MATPLPAPDSRDFARIFSLKKEVMATILSTVVRSNVGSLRKKNSDKIGDLLKEVKGEDPLEAMFGD